jgi:hypothetical protein
MNLILIRGVFKLVAAATPIPERARCMPTLNEGIDEGTLYTVASFLPYLRDLSRQIW